MLSESAAEALRDFLEKEGREWVQEYIRARKAFLAKRKIEASGGLRDSLAAEVQSALEGAVKTNIRLEFEEHGRFVDMKRLRPPSGGSEYLTALAGWVERKGLVEKFVQGMLRKRGKIPAQRDRFLSMVAWGIARKRTGKFRRRAWYAKSSSGGINDLYNRVAGGLPDIVVQEIKAAFGQ